MIFGSLRPSEEKLMLNPLARALRITGAQAGETLAGIGKMGGGLVADIGGQVANQINADTDFQRKQELALLNNGGASQEELIRRKEADEAEKTAAANVQSGLDYANSYEGIVARWDALQNLVPKLQEREAQEIAGRPDAPLSPELLADKADFAERNKALEEAMRGLKIGEELQGEYRGRRTEAISPEGGLVSKERAKELGEQQARAEVFSVRDGKPLTLADALYSRPFTPAEQVGQNKQAEEAAKQAARDEQQKQILRMEIAKNGITNIDAMGSEFDINSVAGLNKLLGYSITERGKKSAAEAAEKANKALIQKMVEMPVPADNSIVVAEWKKLGMEGPVDLNKAGLTEAQLQRLVGAYTRAEDAIKRQRNLVDNATVEANRRAAEARASLRDSAKTNWTSYQSLIEKPKNQVETVALIAPLLGKKDAASAENKINAFAKLVDPGAVEGSTRERLANRLGIKSNSTLADILGALRTMSGNELDRETSDLLDKALREAYAHGQKQIAEANKNYTGKIPDRVMLYQVPSLQTGQGGGAGGGGAGSGRPELKPGDEAPD
jgi:hypothetical protein